MSLTKFYSRVLHFFGVLVASLVLATTFNVLPAGAITSSQTGTSGIPGTITLGSNDPLGVQISNTSSASYYAGRYHSGWEYLSYQATDRFGNKLPRGSISAGYTDSELTYVPYWNFMWWGGNAGTPNEGLGHVADMNANCDDNAYLWSNRLNDDTWKRRWPFNSTDHAVLKGNPNNRFGSYGVQADNYYRSNAGPFVGANGGTANWNGNRDRTNLSGEANGWWSGCVRYQTFRKVYTEQWRVNYSISTVAPCNALIGRPTTTVYEGFLQEEKPGVNALQIPGTTGAAPGMPNRATLSATVDASNPARVTNVRLSYNNSLNHVVNITPGSNFSCQDVIGGALGGPRASFTYSGPGPVGSGVPTGAVYSNSTISFVDTSQPGSTVYPINRWQWRFDRANGQSQVTTTTRNSSVGFNTVNAVVPPAQTRFACLTVWDIRGVASTEVCQNLPVLDRYSAPTVTVSNPGTVQEGQTRSVTANVGSNSHPIVSYQWSNCNASGPQVSFSNSGSQSPNVTFGSAVPGQQACLQVTVRDSMGGTATGNRFVPVTPSPLTVGITNPQLPSGGNPGSVTASPNKPVTSVQWSSCNAATIVFTSPNSLTTGFTAPSNSEICIRVTVTDSFGQTATDQINATTGQGGGPNPSNPVRPS